MRFHRVTQRGTLENGKTIMIHYWAGSQLEAASHRKTLTDRGVKRDEIATTQVDVPTTKAGLQAWLNINARIKRVAAE